ncbi:hypothetical protein F5Y16DRAFT_78161 [Xylariaceae sp. FL0255]|nr:hypothetical protein F5Y16DRAFT_78161 [Xylariaceae sp. FL0255]
MPIERDDRHAEAKDDYRLMRDCNASTRLTAQHYLWKDLLGYLIHPDIPLRSRDLKVADVATGNGIWLHDVADTLTASAEHHGFDICLDQVGPKPWLPATVHMHVWDLFDEPPSQFLGFFDIIHVRLITAVVRNNDPRPVLDNLKKLLKPGGYLQWEEVDNIGCSIKTVPGRTAKNLDELLTQLKGRDDWKYRLSEIMNESGWSNPMIYTYEYGLRTARLWNDVYVSTWKEIVQTVLKTPQASADLEGKAMEDVRNGAAIMIPKLVWVTQKV